MEYSLKLEEITINDFKYILENKDLLPGRKLLRNNLTERFESIENSRVNNLAQLIKNLNTNKRLEEFSKISGVDKDYLILLKREANSYIPKPLDLNKLPVEEDLIIERLKSKGFKNTEDLLFGLDENEKRKRIADELEIPEAQIKEIYELSDLLRITGVGPVFARIILDSDIHSVEEFLSKTPEELLQTLTETNKTKGLTSVRFSLKDIQYCLELGKYLPKL